MIENITASENTSVQQRKTDNLLMEKLLRTLTEKMARPEFKPGGVPVKVAAAVYGKAPCYIHEGIRAGWLPIGHVKPGDQRDNFYISPLKLWEDTGFAYTGQTVKEIEQWKKRQV